MVDHSGKTNSAAPSSEVIAVLCFHLKLTVLNTGCAGVTKVKKNGNRQQTAYISVSEQCNKLLILISVCKNKANKGVVVVVVVVTSPVRMLTVTFWTIVVTLCLMFCLVE